MDLKAIMAREIQPYAGEILNEYAYLTVGADQSVFTVVSVARTKSERITHLSLHIRVVGDHIVIEHNDSSEPLVDALLRAGVSRSQIVLAYTGEAVSETA